MVRGDCLQRLPWLARGLAREPGSSRAGYWVPSKACWPCTGPKHRNSNGEAEIVENHIEVRPDEKGKCGRREIPATGQRPKGPKTRQEKGSCKCDPTRSDMLTRDCAMVPW